MLDLKLDRAPIPPRDAATMVLLRDTRDGIEVFCVERSKKSRFLGGAIVFPGGKLDPMDGEESWRDLVTEPPAARYASRSRDPFANDEAHQRALGVAACRETLEEAAILPLAFLAAPPAPPSQAQLLALRDRLVDDPLTLQAFLKEAGMRLDLSSLHPLSRWVTPEAEARRYDTRFFVAAAPQGQVGAHDDRETMASFWASPADVLARWERGEVQFAPPTHNTLALLGACATTADALALADRLTLDPICPRLVPTGDTMALVLPSDPEHHVPEARAHGPSRYVLRGERWVPEAP